MHDAIVILLWLAAACAISFLINIVPAFMPSTWMILAFFYIQLDVPLIPLAIGGTLASAAGRLYLARGSSLLRRRVIKRHSGDIEELGGFLNEHRRALVPLVFVYALTPLPTNNLFIAAGLAEVRITPLVAGFVASRLLANAFWVWTAHKTIDNLSVIFRNALSPAGVAVQVLGLLSVAAIYFVPWGRWLRRAARGTSGASSQSRPGAAPGGAAGPKA
jgi:hypothetical protein